MALADALSRAAQAGQWSIVKVLAEELRARREAHQVDEHHPSTTKGPNRYEIIKGEDPFEES